MYKYSFLLMKSTMPVASPSTTAVAIAGATGYAGQELVRLLARHPSASLTVAMSSGASSAPRPLPALARIWDDEVVPLDVDRIAAEAEVVFLALPEAASAELGPALVARGLRVVDLSGAFRLRDAALRQQWYPATTSVPAGVVFGVPERQRDAIRHARLIA
jgi:N-acetyl-gamma-glutamyl-phosphate reductase